MCTPRRRAVLIAQSETVKMASRVTAMPSPPTMPQIPTPSASPPRADATARYSREPSVSSSPKPGTTADAEAAIPTTSKARDTAPTDWKPAIPSAITHAPYTTRPMATKAVARPSRHACTSDTASGACQQLGDIAGQRYAPRADHPSVDHQPGRLHDPVPGDRAVVGDLADLRLDAGDGDRLPRRLFDGLAVRTPRPQDFDDMHHGTPYSSSQPDGVEEQPHAEDPDHDDRGEDSDQRRPDDAPQDDELGQADGDDGHHERERRPQRHALREQGLDNGDGAGGVRGQRDRDRDHHRHRQGILPSTDARHHLSWHVPMDDRAQADADEDEKRHASHQVTRVRPRIPQALLHAELQVRRGCATRRPHLEHPWLYPALDP